MIANFKSNHQKMQCFICYKNKEQIKNPIELCEDKHIGCRSCCQKMSIRMEYKIGEKNYNKGKKLCFISSCKKPLIGEFFSEEIEKTTEKKLFLEKMRN